MTKSGKIIMWIIVIVVIIGGIWYFSSRPNSASNQPSNTGTTAPLSSEKAISSFAFSGLTPEVDGIVDNTGYTVNLTVPSGTDLTTLTPTIVVSDNATISPASDVAQDFTNPVTYTVTAQDGSTQNYTVTVTTFTAAQ